jgi:hypothetical protein
MAEVYSRDMRRRHIAKTCGGDIQQKHAADGVYNMEVFTAAYSVIWRRRRRKIDAELVKTSKTQGFSGKD